MPTHLPSHLLRYMFSAFWSVDALISVPRSDCRSTRPPGTHSFWATNIRHYGTARKQLSSDAAFHKFELLLFLLCNFRLQLLNSCFLWSAVRNSYVITATTNRFFPFVQVFTSTSSSARPATGERPPNSTGWKFVNSNWHDAVEKKRSSAANCLSRCSKNTRAIWRTCERRNANSSR